MPEGDTIHGLADRLGRELAGKPVTAAGGTHRAMIEFGRRIVGSPIADTAAHGKHLLIHFANGWTLRTHLRMTGSWHLYVPGASWNRSPGKARAIIETPDRIAVCFAAPTVQLAPWPLIAAELGRLGPDLMEPIDAAAVASALIASAPAMAIGDAIVDQQLMAGLGNVYRSEVLFIEGVHPDRPVGDLDGHEVAAIVARAHRLLASNRGRSRSTTGSRARSHDLWVYGRAGAPCRRCATPIATGRRAPLQRTIFWCPNCQAPR